MHWRELRAHAILAAEENRPSDEPEPGSLMAGVTPMTETSGGFGTPPPAKILELLPRL